MPKVDIVFFADEDGSSPVISWLNDLPKKIRVKGYAKINELAEKGFELHRPQVEHLRDKIYELRWSRSGNQYRILFFHYKRTAVILAHGLIKNVRKVPQKDIDIAINRKKVYELNPSKHQYK